MGILNATPDSFYGRSRANSYDSVTARVSQMIAEGAELIDVGGYSTRPGAEEVSVQEEIARVVPVIKYIKGVSKHVIISLDTFRSEVATEGVKAGAHIINDVSGGTLDAEMFKTIAALQVPYILMH
ncbi:UNVERIFIED_CONTAM: hypothetical protein GTU68_020362, partial [Idotea baltica]|nr:hypothetical protein [Idotea baltica]